MTAVTLRRYTNLAATIQILRNKVITLLSPSTWDDRNDAYFLAQYKKRKGVQTVLALCFAETSETYHHWRVFSHGCDGVCIEFDKARLLQHARDSKRVRSGPVLYREIKEARRQGVELDKLPFVKRYPYHDEKEFRIVYVDAHNAVEAREFPIDISCIQKVTLSPWMPLPLEGAVKATLADIDDCSALPIGRSTLVENEKWKRVARGDEAE